MYIYLKTGVNYRLTSFRKNDRSKTLFGKYPKVKYNVFSPVICSYSKYANGYPLKKSRCKLYEK